MDPEGVAMRKFQDGDDVAHKTAKSHRMTVIGYTGDGKVICRWKEKAEFQREEFLETELEKWVETPAIGFGTMKGDTSNKKW
jgi:uncharacterized protein YodC (DUF2158 family)